MIHLRNFIRNSVNLISTVSKNSINVACKGELGRFPLINDINLTMLKYWQRLENLPTERNILRDAWLCDKNTTTNRNNCISFSAKIEILIQKFNLSRSDVITENLNKSKISHLKQLLEDQYLTYYNTKLKNSEKLLYYKYIQRTYKIAPYLTFLNIMETPP